MIKPVYDALHLYSNALKYIVNKAFGCERMPKPKGFGNDEEKSFNDTSKVDGMYEGDGRDQLDFFRNNSNFEELVNNADDDTKESLKEWVIGRFMNGQQYGDFDNMTNEEKWWTQHFDDLLDRSIINKAVEVVRSSDAQLVLGKGNKVASLDSLKAMEGQIITSKGNMSCAAASKGLGIGDVTKNIEYKIHIPKGSKGAGMYIGDNRLHHIGSMQREFMTNRDSSFRVGKSSYDEKTGKYTVHLHYIGHEQHSYGKNGRTTEKPQKRQMPVLGVRRVTI